MAVCKNCGITQKGTAHQYVGSCDMCGITVRKELIEFVYLGDVDFGHAIRDIHPDRCPGCDILNEKIRILCGPVDVTQELQAEKVDAN